MRKFDSDRVDIICHQCGTPSTASYGHWRKNKSGPFYCKQCAQNFRVSAMNNATNSLEYKEVLKNRINENREKIFSDPDKKSQWLEKITNATQRRCWNNFSEEQKRIFESPEKWFSLTPKQRRQYPVEVKCDVCGKPFTTTWNYYAYGYKDRRKDSTWRCHECSLIHKANVSKQRDPFKHKEGSPYWHEWWDNLTEDERIRETQKRQQNKSPSSLAKRFMDTFNHSHLSKDFYYLSEQPFQQNAFHHVWDFVIYQKSDNQPMLAVDCDGMLYHGDGVDYVYANKNPQEELDATRFQSLPSGMKYHIIYEKDFIRSFEKMIKILMTNYDEFIEHQFQICKSIPFPSPHYTDKELMRSFTSLSRKIVEVDSPEWVRMLRKSIIAMNLINHFHPSIYQAKCKECKYSPYEAWNNDELLRATIANRILYVNELNPNKILQGFNISRIAKKVSVFKPMTAKLLIEKYLSDCNTIVDPFSGFSGRMLGAIVTNKIYRGFDISPIHVRESNNLINFLYLNSIQFDASVECKPIEDNSGCYDALLTCPPYKNKETWLHVPGSDKSCDDWIDMCLSRFDCRQYIFIVDETQKYSDCICETITNESHFGTNSEYVININK